MTSISTIVFVETKDTLEFSGDQTVPSLVGNIPLPESETAHRQLSAADIHRKSCQFKVRFDTSLLTATKTKGHR